MLVHLPTLGQMNFSHLVLPVFLLLRSILSSKLISSSGEEFVFRERVENIVDLTEDIICHIGDVLFCPQKELGFLSKKFYHLFSERHPFHRVLQFRHDIPELKFAECDAELVGPFKKLAHVKDANDLFLAISRGIFVTNSFPINKKFLIEYAIRAYKGLPPEFFASLGYTGTRDAFEIAYKLAEIGDHERTLNFITGHPETLTEFFNRINFDTKIKILDAFMRWNDVSFLLVLLIWATVLEYH